MATETLWLRQWPELTVLPWPVDRLEQERS